MKLSEKKLREILKLFKESDNKDFKDAIVNVVFILSKNRNDVLVDNEGLVNSLKKGLSFGEELRKVFIKEIKMLLAGCEIGFKDKNITTIGAIENTVNKLLAEVEKGLKF